MSRTLLVAQHDDGQLNATVAKAVTCAGQIGAPVDIAIFCAEPGELPEQAAALSGVDRVLVVRHEANAHPTAATLAPQLIALAEDYSHLLAPSTNFGKDLMPRVAALLGVAQVSDIMAVDGPHAFKRPIYAGNAIVSVEAPNESTLVGTVRTASFKATPGGGAAEVSERSLEVELPDHTRHLGTETQGGDRPDLQSANRVVSGGRALGSAEKFEIIFDLADQLGADGGGRRLRAQRPAGGTDRQDHRPGAVLRLRDLRGHPAPHRHQGRRHHRGGEQGPGRADFRGRRHRAGG